MGKEGGGGRWVGGIGLLVGCFWGIGKHRYIDECFSKVNQYHSIQLSLRDSILDAFRQINPSHPIPISR